LPRIFWFGRDLRLQDNEALTSCINAAISDGDRKVIASFWLKEKDFGDLAGIRQHSLIESLRALDESTSGNLHVVADQSVEEMVSLAKKNKVVFVHATQAFDSAGIKDQQQIKKALAKESIELVLEGSNYAVKPGTVRKPSDGTPYKVYTPFFRAWFEIGLQKQFKLPTGFSWVAKEKRHSIPKATKSSPFRVRAGEQFAVQTFEKFKKRPLFDYSENRNRADLSGTSHLSHALAHGEIHPRTILQHLKDTEGHNVYRKEIAWREFYADVLFHNQHTVDDYYEPRFKAMRYDTGQKAMAKLDRWQKGETGFPMVDAGMRQLLETGWMHNRVRMIVASFLVKDLHLEWQHGASWFEKNLSDFDPASNSHGWQWTAGCGTDASPYYRVFNPILQGYKFDPDGNYVRKYIPELRHLSGSEVHEPWLLIDGLVNGYPEPMLDHSKERDESLRRLEEIKRP
jgi:deoxyribodipyrimidine photo-lyase